MSLAQIEAELKRRLAAGMLRCAQEGAKLYRAEVTRITEAGFPRGPFPGPHSSPGEFPNRETGQGADNITFELLPAEPAAAFGVKGPKRGSRKPGHRRPGGLHLSYLMGQGRLGPDSIVRDDKELLAQAFIRGAKSK